MKMTKTPANKEDPRILYVGITAMALLLVGVFSEPASLLQRLLFLIGALMLTMTAYMNRQWTLFVLQIVISMGSLFAFTGFEDMVRYAVLLGASLAGIIYLRLAKRYDAGLWGMVSSAGLFLVAAGFATDANSHPLFFGLFLGLGSLLVALYSFVDYFCNKDSAAAIWLVLNIVFAINPILMVVSALKGH